MGSDWQKEGGRKKGEVGRRMRKEEVQGVSQGETVMPSKLASHRRVLTREEEPISFWAALGVYGLVGLGSGVWAGWFVREVWRLKR
jgi:hypothetical protein